MNTRNFNNNGNDDAFRYVAKRTLQAAFCLEHDDMKDEDPIAIHPFSVDVMSYLESREKQYAITDYTTGQHESIADHRVRAILMDWTNEVQGALRLGTDTLFLSMKLVDVFLSRTRNFSRDNLSCLAISSILLAAKYEETFGPTIDDLSYLGDVNREDILKMELKLFEALDYDLGVPIAPRYMSRWMKMAQLNENQTRLAEYLLEITHLYLPLAASSASKLSAAIVWLTMRMTDPTATWIPFLERNTGMSVAEVTTFADIINHSIRVMRRKWANLNSIEKKYLPEQDKRIQEVDNKKVFVRKGVIAIPLLPDNYNELVHLPVPEFATTE